MNSFGLRIALLLAALAGSVGLLFTFTAPPIVTVQHGFRGTAMGLVYTPAALRAIDAANQVPEPVARVPQVGPRASQVYQNVPVLGDLTAVEFTRLMVAITNWVAPEQGCNYCHVAGNMAAEDLYTKQVSRRMLQMVRHINETWVPHFGGGEGAGVTCYTCHRGRAVPMNVWSLDTGGTRTGFSSMAAAAAGQDRASPSVGLTSLPYDPFTPYLQGDAPIRVIGVGGWRAGENTSSIAQTEGTYGLMMHMSTSLGVNCTFCHNSRSFAEWTTSSPQRTTAWYGIRMVRAINNDYITPLTPFWAANPNGPADGPAGARLGPHGDALKVNCNTCHQGAYRPLLGAPMLNDYPELRQVRLTP